MKRAKKYPLTYFLRGYGKQSVLAPLFKLLEALFDLFVPLVVAEIIDVGIAQNDIPFILRCCALMIALSTILSFIIIFRLPFGGSINVTKQIFLSLCAAYVVQPSLYIVQHSLSCVNRCHPCSFLLRPISPRRGANGCL